MIIAFGAVSDIIEYFFQTLFNPFVNLFDGLMEHLPKSSLFPQGVGEFIKAFIINFIPYKQILFCFRLQLPFILLSVFFKVLLRLKSFVPTMGGK